MTDYQLFWIFPWKTFIFVVMLRQNQSIHLHVPIHANHFIFYPSVNTIFCR